MKWIIDPKSKDPSVPLTLLLITFVVLIAVNVLNVLGKMSAVPESLNQIFWGLAMLYWGHHNVSIGGKIYSSSDNNEKN